MFELFGRGATCSKTKEMPNAWGDWLVSITQLPMGEGHVWPRANQSDWEEREKERDKLLSRNPDIYANLMAAPPPGLDKRTKIKTTSFRLTNLDKRQFATHWSMLHIITLFSNNQNFSYPKFFMTIVMGFRTKLMFYTKLRARLAKL